jgi:hypothetical protein
MIYTDYLTIERIRSSAGLIKIYTTAYVLWWLSESTLQGQIEGSTFINYRNKYKIF